MRELFHRERREHVSQSVVDVRAQLPVRLPIQHAEENALQASLCDVKILGWGSEGGVKRGVRVRAPASHGGVSMQLKSSHRPHRDSLIVLSPALFARLMAYSHTSAASL